MLILDKCYPKESYFEVFISLMTQRLYSRHLGQISFRIMPYRIISMDLNLLCVLLDPFCLWKTSMSMHSLFKVHKTKHTIITYAFSCFIPKTLGRILFKFAIEGSTLKVVE